MFQALLELVHDIFEEQTSLNRVVHKIMRRALTMLKCEKCSVLLLSHAVLGNSHAEDRAPVSMSLFAHYMGLGQKLILFASHMGI